jgi:hypothetical protein
MILEIINYFSYCFCFILFLFLGFYFVFLNQQVMKITYIAVLLIGLIVCNTFERAKCSNGEDSNGGGSAASNVEHGSRNTIVDEFPKLLYMVPESHTGEHTFSEKDSLTNKVINGWVLNADEYVNIGVYMLVEEQIDNPSDIAAGFIYFTNDETKCSEEEIEQLSLADANGASVIGGSSTAVNQIYKLTFSEARSKYYNHSHQSQLQQPLPSKRNAGRQQKHQQQQHQQQERQRQQQQEYEANSSRQRRSATSAKRPISVRHTGQLGQANNTLLFGSARIRLPHNSSKYYTCMAFAKKKASGIVSGTDKSELSIQDFVELARRLRYVHQGNKNVWSHIITAKALLPFYLVIVFYFVLLCFSALFSGLNLGLMSLDLTELNFLKKIGSSSEKKYATKIYPLRQRGNLLLCTILLGNVLVNSTSTLILGSYLQGLLAAIGSTLLIVTFGEIIPQAACSRHGLAVGAHTRYITFFMMGLTFPISFPLSKVLDYFLGVEIPTTYSRDKVRELMRQAKEGKDIEEKQYKLISGALDFKSKTVKEIMVPIKDVFSLDINSVLDFDTFKTILYHGYSRIPVYEHTM